jgi:hypothetical protein
MPLAAAKRGMVSALDAIPSRRSVCLNVYYISMSVKKKKAERGGCLRNTRSNLNMPFSSNSTFSSSDQV